jgi:hypothetical protein
MQYLRPQANDNIRLEYERLLNVECMQAVLGKNENLEEKKLLGSGSHILEANRARGNLRASLGVPQIFLSKVDRLNEDRSLSL